MNPGDSAAGTTLTMAPGRCNPSPHPLTPSLIYRDPSGPPGLLLQHPCLFLPLASLHPSPPPPAPASPPPSPPPPSPPIPPLVGNPTNGRSGVINFVGTQTLGGSGTVVFGNNQTYSGGCVNTLAMSAAGTTLTIGAGITVRGQERTG